MGSSRVGELNMTDFLLLWLSGFAVVLELADSRVLKVASSHTFLEQDVDVTESSALLSSPFSEVADEARRTSNSPWSREGRKMSKLSTKHMYLPKTLQKESCQPREYCRISSGNLQPVLAP